MWTTWKSRYEIFQPGGATPSPWPSYAGANPCGQGIANDVVTLHSFRPFSDFNQAGFDLKKILNPLVAQNRTYVRYEVRVNEPEFNSIVDHKWYIANYLPTQTTFVPFNEGSTAIKAAWRILTDKDTPAIRARYYVVKTPKSTTCVPAMHGAGHRPGRSAHRHQDEKSAAVDMVQLRACRQRAGKDHRAQAARRRAVFIP